jgi:hypothetical protein
MIYTYDSVLLYISKEGNSDTCYDMDELQRYYAMWNKARHKSTNIVWFHLYEVPTVVKYIGQNDDC